MFVLPLTCLIFASTPSGDTLRNNPCLAPISRGKPAIKLWQGENGIVAEHSCSSWNVAPKHLTNVVVVPQSGGTRAVRPETKLATSQPATSQPATSQPATSQPATSQSEPTVRIAFPQQKPIVYAEVARGDRLNKGVTVVSVSQDLVLLDVDGALAAVTKGQPVSEWRMIWHSRFFVPSASGGGGSSSSSSSAKSKAPKGLAASRKAAKSKAKKHAAKRASKKMKK